MAERFQEILVNDHIAEDALVVAIELRSCLKLLLMTQVFS
jgi:hypothetical protein